MTTLATARRARIQGSDVGGVARDAAVGQLLRDLLAVKGWVRDTSRAVHPASTTTALLALSLLERHGPARLGELAELARVDASVVSRQVQSLEQHGLVVRAPDARDGRAQLVSISPAGAAALDEGRRQLEDLVSARLAHWSSEELGALSAALHRLLADLHGPPAPTP